jgi:hypothetical protein
MSHVPHGAHVVFVDTHARGAAAGPALAPGATA